MFDLNILVAFGSYSAKYNTATSSLLVCGFWFQFQSCFCLVNFVNLAKATKEPEDSRNLFHTNTTRTSAIRCRKERMAPFGQKSRIF